MLGIQFGLVGINLSYWSLDVVEQLSRYSSAQVICSLLRTQLRRYAFEYSHSCRYLSGFERGLDVLLSFLA